MAGVPTLAPLTTRQIVVSGVALLLVLVAVAHMTGTGNTSIRTHVGRAGRAARRGFRRPPPNTPAPSDES